MLLVAVMVSTAGCKKDWMAEKRDISLVVPSSLQDMRRLLNDANTFRNDYRMLASLAADEYYIDDDKYNAIADELVRNSYIWNDVVFDPRTTQLYWGNLYKQVFYANVVLEGLDKIVPRADELVEYNEIKGTALFFRARAFYSLAVQFAGPYIIGEGGEGPGIPLRLGSDIHAPVRRNTLKETYDRITGDLQLCTELLPNEPNVRINPSKASAMGLLARCYLSMADYGSAYRYADSSLGLYNKLMDLNDMDPDARFPFALYNEEVLIDSPFDPIILENTAPNGIVDSVLYREYEENDLRKHIFFARVSEGDFAYRGSYHGDWGNFGGMSVNEVLLIRSECAARMGNVDSSLDDLNYLLSKRYRTGTFKPLSVSDAEQLLTVVLLERRKELLFRGLRWEDLRRLNKEPGREVTLVRTVMGETHVLEPLSSNYVFKIPESVIIETGIEQN